MITTMLSFSVVFLYSEPIKCILVSYRSGPKCAVAGPKACNDWRPFVAAHAFRSLTASHDHGDVESKVE